MMHITIYSPQRRSGKNLRREIISVLEEGGIKGDIIISIVSCDTIYLGKTKPPPPFLRIATTNVLESRKTLYLLNSKLRTLIEWNAIDITASTGTTSIGGCLFPNDNE